MRKRVRVVFATFAALLLHFSRVQRAAGYAFNETVPDVRLPASLCGGSACPMPSRQTTLAGSIAVRWSTALSANPANILTLDRTSAGRLNEIEQAIQQSLAVWTGVSGMVLKQGSLAPLTRVTKAVSCGANGLNSVCFDQSDMAFTPGVLAFTRVVTADHVGEQLSNGPAATLPGQILKH